MLDEVLDAVFEDVGLPKDPTEDDGFEIDVKTAQNQGSVRVPTQPIGHEKASQEEAPRDNELDHTAYDVAPTSSYESEDIPVGPNVALAPFPRELNYLHGAFFQNEATDSLFFDRWSHPWDLPPEQWGHFASHDRSIMADFFVEQDGSQDGQIVAIGASSTAASIASSDSSDESEGGHNSSKNSLHESQSYNGVASLLKSSKRTGSSRNSLDASASNKSKDPEVDASNETVTETHEGNRSPSPQPPSTPSPTLSPILVSLDDLKKMRSNNDDGLPPLSKTRSFSSVPSPTSVPNSPHRSLPPSKGTRGAATVSPHSFSARHLIRAPTSKARDDHDLHRPRSRRLPSLSIDATNSYRDAVTGYRHARDDADIQKSGSAVGLSRKTLVRPRSAAVSVTSGSPRQHDFVHVQFESSKMTAPAPMRDELCAQSVDAVDGHGEDRGSHAPHESDHRTAEARDGSTITSNLSPRASEDAAQIREERDTLRDMCLTLGAEVAKLNNLLAAQQGTSMLHSHGFPPVISVDQNPSSVFDPESVSRFYRNHRRPRTLAAMSDAGNRGDFESLASEDDAMGRIVVDRAPPTVAGSDISMERSGPHLGQGLSFPSFGWSREMLDPVSGQGIQSRLSIDILQFLETTKVKIGKQHGKRQKAVERISRLVNTVWPRAQVKLYGSHVTGLCLPSSDVDFVICLPAVHKNAPAVAPGALEGRNAINETSQKLLARKLKEESWVDPKTMKLIERTAVPVIKVTTRDTKSKLVQLDITFDAPGHHGLDAVDMVKATMEELPMLRPLILVLKQFLLDRGLLTAYTGGLSSYCLFLMLARYLQEQQSSWNDSGSLLMGFLDFYGNHFDPRSTGITVLNRQYFARPTYGPAITPNQTWAQAARNPVPASISVRDGTRDQFYRRNSFSDKSAAAGNPRHHVGWVPKTQYPRYPPQSMPNQNEVNQEPVMPYTLDPLLVEDPLDPTNNVGRNAFRIFQVQRAFSDAHRALVAALEWDMQSTGDSHEDTEYPLLKCLLQSKDVVFDL